MIDLIKNSLRICLLAFLHEIERTLAGFETGKLLGPKSVIFCKDLPGLKPVTAFPKLVWFTSSKLLRCPNSSAFFFVPEPALYFCRCPVFFTPIPCTYPKLRRLGGVARIIIYIFFCYMETLNHANYHDWLHFFVPTTLCPRE